MYDVLKTVAFSKYGMCKTLSVSCITMVLLLLCWNFFHLFFKINCERCLKTCLESMSTTVPNLLSICKNSRTFSSIFDTSSILDMCLYSSPFLTVSKKQFGSVSYMVYRDLMSKMLQFPSLCSFNHLNAFPHIPSNTFKQILPWSMVTDILYM